MQTHDFFSTVYNVVKYGVISRGMLILMCNHQMAPLNHIQCVVIMISFTGSMHSLSAFYFIHVHDSLTIHHKAAVTLIKNANVIPDQISSTVAPETN